MALRSNTIEYVFDTNVAGLALATRFDFAAKTLYIPENVSRTFTSAEIEIMARDNIGVAASVSSWLIGIKLGAVAFDDVTQTVTLTNSGDHMSFQFDRNALAYFNTNFGTGASQTCQVGVTFGAVAMLPISVKLILSYEYDDSEVRDTGTATSGGATTLTNTGKAYTVNAFAGSYLKITGGTGSGQTRKIASNTATVITVTVAWGTNPDATSTYEVYLGRVKTVRIPLESRIAQETNTLTEIGTNQVPLLDTFLPEADKTYRQVWFETEYNDGGNAATNFNLALSLDAEGEVSRGVLNQTLNTAVFGRDIWIRDDMTTSAVHAFKARSNNLTARFSLLSPVLCVTYEYNHKESTSVINSLKLPIDLGSGYYGVVAQPRRADFKLWIEEPGSIALVQSGALIRVHDTAAVVVSVKTGAQSVRTYTLGVGSAQSGHSPLMHRIDSGSAQGAMMTLARGLNEFSITAYASANGTGFDTGGWLYLNYTSGKAVNGAGVHNHTVQKDILDMNNAIPVFRISSALSVMAIPETNYFINGLGLEIGGIIVGDITIPVSLSADILTGEFSDDGRATMRDWQFRTDGEFAVALMVADVKNKFDRFAEEVYVDRLGIEDARAFEIDSPSACYGLSSWVTYHSITATVSGVVRGYIGDGSGIVVKLYRGTTNEYLQTTTTAAGGTFSFTMYDDVHDVYCVAYLDDQHAGRSKSDPAGAGFDIYISPMRIYPAMGS